MNDYFYKDSVKYVPDQRDLIENVLEDGDKDDSEHDLDNDMEMLENVLEDGDVENDKG